MRVLVTLGHGLGNVIMATPTVQAVVSLGCETVVGLDKIATGFSDVFMPWPGVAKVVLHGETVTGPIDRVVRTYWAQHGDKFGVRARELGPLPIPFTTHHEAEVNLSAAQRLGYLGPLPDPFVGYDEPGDVGLPTSGYVVCASACNPSPEWNRKRWPDSHWVQLAKCVQETAPRNLPVVFVGAPHDSRPWMDAAGLNLCGQISLRQTGGVLKRAVATVAIDCGLAHFSAALGAKTLVLNGAGSVVKNRPLGPNVVLLQSPMTCSPCHYTERWRACENPGQCLEAISVSAVMQRLEKML